MASSDLRELLAELRAAGFTVRAEAGQLRISPASRLEPGTLSRIRAEKPAILAALPRSPTEEYFSPADPATVRQLERLRELAGDAGWGEAGDLVGRRVERAIDEGLSELGAWRLIGELGGSLARLERGRAAAAEGP